MIRAKDAKLAKRFCRAYAARGVLRGSFTWDDARWIKTANAMLAGLDDQRAAQLLASLRASSASVTISGCHCLKCGRLLTAVDSVAAQVGPECMAA